MELNLHRIKERTRGSGASKKKKIESGRKSNTGEERDMWKPSEFDSGSPQYPWDLKDESEEGWPCERDLRGRVGENFQAKVAFCLNSVLGFEPRERNRDDIFICCSTRKSYCLRVTEPEVGLFASRHFNQPQTNWSPLTHFSHLSVRIEPMWLIFFFFFFFCTLNNCKAQPPKPHGKCPHTLE